MRRTFTEWLAEALFWLAGIGLVLLGTAVWLVCVAAELLIKLAWPLAFIAAALIIAGALR